MKDHIIQVGVRLYHEDKVALEQMAEREGKTTNALATELLIRGLYGPTKKVEEPTTAKPEAPAEPVPPAAVSRVIAAIAAETRAPVDPILPGSVRRVVDMVALETQTPAQTVLVELVSSMLACLTLNDARSLMAGNYGYVDLLKTVQGIHENKVVPLLTAQEVEAVPVPTGIPATISPQ